MFSAAHDMDFSKLDGLIPAVVQDDATGEVLMVGFMNDEALRKTRDTGFATFFSRSRGALWTKGETSGQPARGEADPRGLRRGHGPAQGRGARRRGRLSHRGAVVFLSGADAVDYLGPMSSECERSD